MKVDLIGRWHDDRKAYGEAKTAFVLDNFDAAESWAGITGWSPRPDRAYMAIAQLLNRTARRGLWLARGLVVFLPSRSQRQAFRPDRQVTLIQLNEHGGLEGIY